MIFNVKSINTVYIAGKEVDGMKRPREPPTGGNRMNIGRILPTEAAAILNVSPQFVRVAMQQGKLPMFYIHARMRKRRSTGEKTNKTDKKSIEKSRFV